MNCHNHSETAAAGTCTGCAEAFCANCLVTIQGARYCAACKTMAVQANAAPVVLECREAGEALKYAIFGVFCFGIVLEPIAISKALNARRMIDTDPTLGGRGKATAALVIAVVALALWVLGMFSRLSRAG